MAGLSKRWGCYAFAAQNSPDLKRRGGEQSTEQCLFMLRDMK